MQNSNMPKIAIISDFSKTLTSKDNPTTWSVFAKSGLLGEKYTKERDQYYNEYHQFELQGDVEKTKQWWSKHLDLFVKYGLNKELIDKITKDKNYFAPREGLNELVSYVTKNNVNFFIISSGVSDFIKSFLKGQDIALDNIKIYGNEITYDDENKVVGFDKSSVITTINKYDHNIDLEDYQKVVLLGDDKTDLDMYQGECLKIGFCDQDVAGYDVYLGKDGSLNDVVNILEDL